MELFLVSLLAGVFTSDVTAIAQIMISRPVFCGPVIGMILGDIESGVYLGMAIELLWVSVVPLGNSVPPDSTVVVVSATYIASRVTGSTDLGFLLFLIICLVPAGILFKKLDIWHRSRNSFFTRNLDEKIKEGELDFIEKYTYLSMLLFVLKGAVFTFVVILVGNIVLPGIYSALGDKIKNAFNDSFYFVLAVGFGSAITTFMFKKSRMQKK